MKKLHRAVLILNCIPNDLEPQDLISKQFYHFSSHVNVKKYPCYHMSVIFKHFWVFYLKPISLQGYPDEQFVNCKLQIYLSFIILRLMI